MTTAYINDNSADRETLSRLKSNVENSYLYFKDNYERFRTFRSYIFKESINDQQRSFLRKLSRPILEFNIGEAYISRLLGEFAEHEPSICVSPAEGVPVEQEIIDLVSGHFRYLLHEANKDSFSDEIYKDTLSGGFSVAKVYTDYSSPMSFKQNIYIKKAFDPSLCGFDPMARTKHKGDGNFCFEIYPMTDKDFLMQFANKNIEDIDYSKLSTEYSKLFSDETDQDIEGFKWAFKDIKDSKIILVCEYFEKKKRRTRIVELANGEIIEQSKLKKLKQYWEENNIIEQFPVVKGKPRWTTLEVICKYTFCDNQILDYEETDYALLPLVFFDGNSINLSMSKVNSTYQMTRPYLYHMRGAQDLKNFAGQALANYLQNMVQHKFIIKKEAIVKDADSLEALKNIQRMNNIVVNAYNEGNPDQAIPEPIREVVPVPAPPEIMGAFQITDPTTQTILGSFASNLGKNDQDLSGKAVIESASIGNSAAMPYVMSYLSGLTQIANIVVDLMPKYLLGERTLPIIDIEQNRKHEQINKKGAPYLRYQERALMIQVDAGVNFQVQKNRAVQQIISLMQASEELNKFFNSEKGMKILAKNLQIYGADNLETAIEEFIKEQQQQQQQAMQMQQQMMMNDPAMLRAKAELEKVQIQDRQNQVENEIKIAQLQIDKQLAEAKLMEAESKISESQINQVIRLEEGETSRFNHSIDNATKIAEIEFKEHQKEMDRLQHERGNNNHEA